MKADAPALVAITRAEDLHADLVLAKVDMLDIPYLRIDVPALADAVAMSVYELGRTRVKLESDAVSADLSRVRTIWWRKPTITSLAPDHVTEWIDLERL